MKIASKNINKEKIFSYEEKEEKKKRKLILIDYSEEEKQAALSSEYGTIGKEGEGGSVCEIKYDYYFTILFTFFHFLKYI